MGAARGRLVRQLLTESVLLALAAAQLTTRVGSQLPLQHPEHRHRQALTGLQHDIAHKTITNHHVHPVLKQVMSFDIADKIQFQRPAQTERPQSQFVAFGFLGPNAEDSHPRLRATEHLARIHAPHHREMRQVQGLAFNIGA